MDIENLTLFPQCIWRILLNTSLAVGVIRCVLLANEQSSAEFAGYAISITSFVSATLRAIFSHQVKAKNYIIGSKYNLLESSGSRGINF